MTIQETMNTFCLYLCEGEQCSAPILVQQSGKPCAAVFTFFAQEQDGGMTIYGYGQELIEDGGSVLQEEKALFGREEELIVLRDLPRMSVQERDARYSAYYAALDALRSELEQGEAKPETVAAAGAAFDRLIPPDGVELYRRIAPWFVDLIAR